MRPRTGARAAIPMVALIAAMAAFALMPRAGVAVPEVPLPQTGKELYQAACANCHGGDGRGAPQSQLGFDVPMPDFTDCSFATREPNADWGAVAHEGGPVRGFSRFMPAFGGVLSWEEIQLILGHVRTLCGEEAWPRGELNLPRPLVTGKAYPEDEVVFIADVQTEDAGRVTGIAVYEQRFGARNNWEVVVPFGFRERDDSEEGSGWASGIGDVAVAAKRAVYHSREKGSIFTVAGEVVLPTGDEENGFGKGTTVIEPYLAYGQLLPADFFLQSQLVLEFPLDSEKAENEGSLRLALGRSFTSGQFGRTWSPMLEVVAGRELSSGTGTDWDLVPQLHFTLNTRQHIMLNVGVRTPVSDASTRETRFLVHLLWDWFDGGFLEGW